MYFPGDCNILLISLCVLFFDVAYIFKLKDHFDSLVPLPFMGLGHSLTYENPGAAHTKKIFLEKTSPNLLSFLTHFDFASALLHYIPMVPILFCYFISTFMFFLQSLQMINI